MRIGYISDLHIEFILNHMDAQYGASILEKTEYVLNDICKKVNDSKLDILLIVGDLGESDFSEYVMSSLQSKLQGVKVISILGNHEVWWFDDFKTCVNGYKALSKISGFTFLQNSIVYLKNNIYREVSEDELLTLEDNEIAQRLDGADLIIFGGLGFAGYNSRFCATQRIYRNTVERNEELDESDKINYIYYRIKPLLRGKGIVVTHMPKIDWCRSGNMDKNIIFVSGHTHKNRLVERDGKRYYADNQIGYCEAYDKEFISIKYFEMEDNK